EGAAGFDIAGQRVYPNTPKDCDLSTLIGPGTELVRTPEGEFIVSVEEGFLNLDPETNKISIGKKIVNHDGVSGRTTGNLRLNAGDFEEFGEVQEKRIVEGHNITIHGVVFGNIISKGGDILLHNNLMGGTVTNKKGNIHLKGNAASASVQALDGEVFIHRAEASVIAGKVLHIEHASNCEIVADEVHIKQAEGCVIAAKVIQINSCAPRKQNEMQLLIMVPETDHFEREEKELKIKIQEMEQLTASKKVEADEIPERPDVKKYITIVTKVRNKEVVLTPEQAAAVQKLAQKIAPDLKQAAKLDAEIKDLAMQISAANQQIETILQQKQHALAQSECTVDTISGDTQLRLLRYNPQAEALFLQAAKDVKSKLRHVAMNGKILASATQGCLHWHHQEPATH
ncbi:MAG TPA: hypothetical protein VFM46_17145, partial [Pseudomonadales bacterium]|nr:hypothetical protein [Pseudomonadales bacterium]